MACQYVTGRRGATATSTVFQSQYTRPVTASRIGTSMRGKRNRRRGKRFMMSERTKFVIQILEPLAQVLHGIAFARDDRFQTLAGLIGNSL